MRTCVFIGLVALAMAPTSARSEAQTIWLVDEDDGSDTLNSGFMGWDDAYASIGKAISQGSAGDTILVSHGTYGPAQDATYGSIDLQDDVTILGGFLGFPSGSVNPNDPDGSFDQTIISGDGNQRACIADSGVSTRATLRGFRVEDGSSANGGGLFASSTDNLAIELVTFADNDASVNGGAISVSGTNTGLQIDRCTFENNNAVLGGGAVHVGPGNEVDFANGVFSGNGTFTEPATRQGGALSLDLGSTVSAANCLFNENRALWGGAIYIVPGEIAQDAEYTFRNCTISRNGTLQAQRGSGIHIYKSGDNDQTEVLVTNSILWLNPPGTDVHKETGNVQVTIQYSDVQGFSNEGGASINTMGIIQTNPMFLNAAAGNFRLQNGSPCIDAGVVGEEGLDVADIDDDGNFAESLPLDLDLGLRRIDGFPFGSGVIDMGAYERGPTEQQF